ncbi:hypothetical protein PYCC9005_000073 [Savitreella phatthalungensis]
MWPSRMLRVAPPTGTKTYHDPRGFGVSPALLRARTPYRWRNLAVGVVLVSFVTGVYTYSIVAVKQDDFSDVIALDDRPQPAGSGDSIITGVQTAQRPAR